MSTISDIQKAVGVSADGVAGTKTLAAIAARLGCAANWCAVQKAVGAKADGLPGSLTFAAIAARLGVRATVTQAEVRSGKSVYGKAGDEAALVYVKPPYPIYYDGKEYKHGVRVHKRVADSLAAVFADVLKEYGAEKIHKLGLDVYDGAYTYKRTAGGGSLSVHAWGLAIDWGAARNGLRVHAPQAQFSGPEYAAWWRIWERHGWHSLGREKDYDWMHVQAVSF